MESIENSRVAHYTEKTRKREVSMGGPGKGKKGLYVELPVAVLERLRAFAEDRGEKLADVVGLAVTRHMDNPPTVSPLPPYPPKPPPGRPGGERT